MSSQCICSFVTGFTHHNIPGLFIVALAYVLCECNNKEVVSQIGGVDLYTQSRSSVRTCSHSIWASQLSACPKKAEETWFRTSLERDVLVL